jgi:hypothetical protein
MEHGIPWNSRQVASDNGLRDCQALVDRDRHSGHIAAALDIHQSGRVVHLEQGSRT